jgi:hypothetical protein
MFFLIWVNLKNRVLKRLETNYHKLNANTVPHGYCEKYTTIASVIRKDPLPPLELNAIPFREPEVQQDLFVHLNQSGLEHQRHPPPEMAI